jgi:two-component system NtrC family sensor kinase
LRDRNKRLAEASDQHRRRAENLMSLALELRPSIHLPGFVERFTMHAADLLGARAAALALARRSHLEFVYLHGSAATADKASLRQLSAALTRLASERSEPVCDGRAADLLGQALAETLGWPDVELARMTGSEGDLLGVLFLADRGRKLSPTDRELLLALAGHASITLENSRLFSTIEQSRKQWVEVFDAITDYIVVHDQNNRVLRANRPLADLVGVPPAELIGVSMRALNAIAPDGALEPCPFCHVSRDDSGEPIYTAQERTYLVSTSQIRGGADESTRTIHVLKDITDRREAERRYRELFDNIQEGLFFSTPEGRFLEVNDALVRMLGYESREELLPIGLAQLYLWPEHRQRFLEAIEKHGVVRNHDVTLRRKDGSVIHTLQNVLAVRDAHGRVVQHRGLMLDVTEQKNFQSQLERERDFNLNILNNTQSMILVLDTAGLVSYANRRCFEAGYREGDLLGRPLIDFVPESRRDALTAALESTLRGHQVDNLELAIRASDGRNGQFSANLSPMRDEEGIVNSIVVVMADVTDATILQGKLRHAEKMAAVGQLVSGVAHEVNNPLAAILGFTDLLLENEGLPETAKESLRVILQEAERTKVIVQNLLSFARQTPAQRTPVQLNAVLRSTLKLRAYDFSSHGLEIVERLQRELPRIIGDSHQLQQVFLNILNNAYDALSEARRPGRIEIESSHRDGYAEVSFRDNGPGIAYPDRIFDPFFTTKEVGRGTGLGLSICYGIVREHGGEILCHNNVGMPGSTFTVRLPIAGRTAALAAVEPGR